MLNVRFLTPIRPLHLTTASFILSGLTVGNFSGPTWDNCYFELPFQQIDHFIGE